MSLLQRQFLNNAEFDAVTEASDVPSHIERMPIAAVEVFGNTLSTAQQYVSDLSQYGEMLGLLGPREYDRLWTRHLLNCAVVADELHGTVADVGSGAGLPGLVFAILRPDLKFVLIETMERRAQWLTDEAERLNLHNVLVWNARAEDCVGRDHIDVVTARAVSALRTLIPWTAPLLQGSGRLMFLKGRSAPTEIESAQKVIRKSKIQTISVQQFGVGLLDIPTTVVDAVI